MSIIQVKNVSYTYGEGTPFCQTALSDFSLEFTEGQITGLMGHTGSGKSTLVQMLNGLLRPATGQVLLDGQDIWAKPKEIGSIRFRVGLVFQYPEYQLFEETVEKDIAFGPKNMGLSADEIAKRVRRAMQFVGLGEEYLAKSPFELSGGQKRRVAIAGIIAMDPEVLILDEPAAGLDPMGREEILGGVRSYQRQRKNTVIIVSHSMEDMARYADRLVVIKNGSPVLQGTTAEVFRQKEQLRNCSLEVPQISRLATRLTEAGLPLGEDIYTVEAAKEAILSLYRDRKEKNR